MSFFNSLSELLPPWLHNPNDEKHIIICSRIRLARNLAKEPFPGWATRQQRVEILNRMVSAVSELPGFKQGHYSELSRLSQLDKQLLVESHLMSRDLAARSEGCGIYINKALNMSILFNEEDHMRFQMFQAGLSLKQMWNSLSKLDSKLEDKLPYAYSSRFGYLTACPSNLGTGMRASIMMHLPGLMLSEQMQQVSQAAFQLNIAVRGLYGEGTDATGNLFQISNQSTLGDSEVDIIGRVTRFANDLAVQEWNARLLLLKNNPRLLKDKVCRAYGILMHAQLISTQEALALLSILRLGESLQIFKHQSLQDITKTILNIQPAHIRSISPQLEENSEDRDEVRASLLRALFINS